MLDTPVYPVRGLLYFRFWKFVRIKLTDRIKQNRETGANRNVEKTLTPKMWGMKAISERERILLAWFLDALLFIRIVWKCVKWQNQFQKEHGSVSKSLKPGMWKSSVHSCTMASKKHFMAIPTPMILPLFETKRLEYFMTKLRLSQTLVQLRFFGPFPRLTVRHRLWRAQGMQHSEAKRRPCICHGSPILRKYHSPNVTYLLRNYSFVLDPFILMVHRLPVFCFISMHGAAQERL